MERPSSGRYRVCIHSAILHQSHGCGLAARDLRLLLQYFVRMASHVRTVALPDAKPCSDKETPRG